MFTKEISRKRLPSIKYLQDNEEKIFCCSDKTSPLDQTLKSTSKSLYLVAMAGQGKTTTLRALWLDYLCGNSETACLYIELKFLDKNKKNRAIRDYVFNEYRIELDKLCANQLILLLDGVDELEPEFKSNNLFASECEKLLEKFRLVICERSYKKEYNSKIEKTSYGLDISKMQCCELCELTNNQLLNIGIEVKEDTALYNLLKNNMMLSIYSDLKAYGIKIDQDNITSGELLDYYFNISIKTKFIKRHLNLTDNKVELYEKIKEVECLDRSDCQGYQRDIFYALQELTEVFEFLKDFAIYSPDEDDSNNESYYGIGISYDELKEQVKINLDTLDSISILKQNGKQYYWNNEIYKTYFAACRLRDVFKSLQLGKPILEPDSIYFQNDYMSYTGYCFWNIGHRGSCSSSVYLAIIYACELLGLKSKDDIESFRNEVINRLNENNSKDVKRLTRDMEDVLCVFSVLKGWGFPDYTTAVSTSQFASCHLIDKIIIPKQITQIGSYAFGNCENLSELTLPNTLKEIGGFAFAGTNITKLELPESLEKLDSHSLGAIGIKKIKMPLKIKKIESGTFAGCEELKEVILPDGLEEIGFGAFGDWMSGCLSLEYIKLPSSLKKLDDMAFVHCGLKKIFLPKGLEKIGNAVFSLCMNLTDIFCERENLPVGWDKNWLDGCMAKVHWGCKADSI